MKALVAGSGEPSVTERPRPELREPTDVIVRLRRSALGQTDLLFANDPSCRPPEGTVLGHQGVGEVVEAGSDVRDIRVGDRVVISATVACGRCAYCKVGFYAQCVEVNPRGLGVGGVYLGGPGATPALDGTHAEYVRIPFADVGLMAIPDGVPDEQALLLSEMLPLGYFGAKLARICAGDRVAVLGADPSGLMAAATSLMLGAGRVIVVDDSEARLELASGFGVETVLASPAGAGAVLRDCTDDRGVQCAIVTQGAGMDHLDRDSAGGAHASRDLLDSAVTALSRDSTLALVGVYPREYAHYPLGIAVGKYVTIKAAACNHSKYLRPLFNIIGAGVLRGTVLEDAEALADVVEPERAYAAARTSERGWVHVAW
jgi:threonine dehydrogenase-like Zn-dependent dehydrogenase